MRFKATSAIAVLSAGWITLSGCNIADNIVDNQSVSQASTQPSQTVTQVSIISSTVTVAPNGELVLAVTVRLYNPTSQPVQLLAGTPCSVFRWAVASADKIVQTKPNQLCVQVVATERLLPYSSIEQRHEIVLDSAQYRSGNQYLLRYQFWHHDGTHVFTLTDIVSHD